MLKYWLIVIAVLTHASLEAQGLQYKKSEVLSSSAPVKVKVSEITPWQAQVQRIEAPVPGGDSYRDFLRELKKDINRSGSQKRTGGGTAILGIANKPVFVDGFEGNSQGGIPNDNDVAISNDGQLISVINSRIMFYDTNLDSILSEVSLMDFASTLGITPRMYDPKVAYDPKEDKFIMVWLSGSEVAQSSIIFAFSESADPLGTWNLYSLPGDTLDGQTWTDYPAIALSDNELILTGNALIDDTINTNDSWKFLFKESLIWQIDKAKGYAGDPLALRLYTGIYYNNQPIRNLCPVKGATSTYGPEVYLLSNRNFALTNDTIFMLRISGNYDDPRTSLAIELQFTDVPYGLAPDAKQPTGRELQTNDSRVLGAYITEDGFINYVQNTVLPDSARCGVYHGIIDLNDNQNTIKGNIIGDYDMDFGYPNISYTGRYVGDHEALISFNYTSQDSFPGVAAVYYNDKKLGYSERVVVKEGNSPAYFGNGTPRWGDYTGSQTKYNEPGTVWFNGFWGDFRIGSFPRNANVTWVASLSSPDVADSVNLNPNVSAPIVEEDLTGIKTYPNPATDKFHTQFDIAEEASVSIKLMDINGRHIKTFMKDWLEPGEHLFSFSLEPLEAGVYFLLVQTEDSLLFKEQIVKQ